MRLCIGTAKGIVILDPSRDGAPLMVLADPSAVWCMAQDCADPNLIYAGSTEQIRGKGTLARSTDGGRTWTDVTPPLAREEEVWSVASSPAVKDRVFIGTSHARLFRSDDRGRVFKESDGFLKIPGRDRWTFPPPPHIPHVRSIAFDPHEPSTMYVGVEEGGIFRSRNDGASFESLNDGLYVDIHTVAVDSRDSRRLYATTGAGFFMSQRGQLMGTGDARPESHLHNPAAGKPARSREIFTAAAMGPPPSWRVGPTGADAMLFRSADRGESFTPISAEQNFGRGMVMRLKPDPDNGGFFAVCNDGAVMRATYRRVVTRNDRREIAARLRPRNNSMTRSSIHSGLGALGCGIVLARIIFARIEKRTVRISDPKASTRLPSHVDTERLLFLVFATEWVLLAIFVFADRLPAELQRFVSSPAYHQPPR